MIERRRITVQGIVQGIGFRPFVYCLAEDHGLSGSVRNHSLGAVIELQGDAAGIEKCLARIESELPPAGRLDQLQTASIPLVAQESRFTIVNSSATGPVSISLAPDRDVCPDCLREMSDPEDRRFGYPFINCTRCGPRYTITQRLPYDRPNTTMADFAMCADCLREYADPRDRRYHAQPIACPACGPKCWLVQTHLEYSHALESRGDSGDAIARAASKLKHGEVVAVKGIGGFHLAVDAANNEAVRRLREYKNRPRKPLAVMARDLETARICSDLNVESERLLCLPTAPIVVVPRRKRCPLSEAVAPGLSDVGVMLPYSPLHHLLFNDGPRLLVMTSGNHPAEPITIDNNDVMNHLRADAYLLHDREIHVANDDSVIKTGVLGPVFLRRSRGYVPEKINASHLPRRSVLALGAELKATVSTLRNGDLVVGRHLGDLDNPRAEEAFRQEVDRMLDFGGVEPEAIAVDLHPDLASTQFAEKRFADWPLIRVQHHHAHLAAVMIEHGIEPDIEVIGILLDGFGYGADQTIWGGEILRGGYAGFERLAHLRNIPQPGGDRAANEPHRMATSLLLDAGLAESGFAGFDDEVAGICTLESVSPLTSSTGRLFDGVASLLGIAPEKQDYEGEAAARLEAAADPLCEDAYPLAVSGEELDTRCLISALLEDPVPLSTRAARFHNGLADGLAKVALAADEEIVVLGGGCMVNRLLLCRLVTRIKQAGKRALWPRLLPPGDGGLSAGQAACAVCMIER